jgi:hypothetical protein
MTQVLRGLTPRYNARDQRADPATASGFRVKLKGKISKGMGVTVQQD